MQNELYDIGIIGGGLAGLCLAIQSAEAGYKVILFEKEQYPFHKVCGEYISLESWEFLNRLGLPLKQYRLPLIKQLNISVVEGKLYSFDLPLGGFGISRYKLDNELYKIALNKGVTVCTQTKVNEVQFSNDQFNIFSPVGQFKATVVAGTYGKRSNLDIKWKRSFVEHKAGKLNNYIGVKYHIKYPLPKELIALHNFKNGYCGISNIEDSKCCLCYLTTGDNLKSNDNSIKKMEANILYKNPHLNEIFSQASFLYEAPLVISQISFSKKSQVEDHVLMIGDAAGMITPLCGNGMSMAMHASKIAFDNIHSFLQNKFTRITLEERYENQWSEQFAKRLAIGRTVQKIFDNKSGTTLFLKLMSQFPFIARQVIKSTHGKHF